MELRWSPHYLVSPNQRQHGGIKMDSFSRADLELFQNQIGNWRNNSWDEREQIIGASLEAFSQRLHRGEVINNVNYWLLLTAKNCRKALIRDSAQRRERECHQVVEAVSHEYKSTHDALNPRLEIAVTNALESLSSIQREMIILCDMQDVTPADAARELNLNYSTALSALKRGRIRLSQNEDLRQLAYLTRPANKDAWKIEDSGATPSN